MKCALPDCEKEASYRTLCCSAAHSRRLGGLVRTGVLPKSEKPKIEPIKRILGPRGKSYKDWNIAQKSKHRAWIIARQKRMIVPPWANKKSIEEFYLKARMLTESTGIPHEVDHIIPITHSLVCGLHVENNLQILTKEENLKKSNRFNNLINLKN